MADRAGASNHFSELRGSAVACDTRHEDGREGGLGLLLAEAAELVDLTADIRCGAGEASLGTLGDDRAGERLAVSSTCLARDAGRAAIIRATTRSLGGLGRAGSTTAVTTLARAVIVTTDGGGSSTSADGRSTSNDRWKLGSIAGRSHAGNKDLGKAGLGFGLAPAGKVLRVVTTDLGAGRGEAGPGAIRDEGGQGSAVRGRGWLAR